LPVHHPTNRSGKNCIPGKHICISGILPELTFLRALPAMMSSRQTELLIIKTFLPPQTGFVIYSFLGPVAGRYLQGYCFGFPGELIASDSFCSNGLRDGAVRNNCPAIVCRAILLLFAS
jgi:hypothetical protein